MLKLFRIVTLFTFLGLVLSGCEFKDLTLNRVESFNLDGVSEKGMEATINLVITNPNSYPINVTKADFDLFSNGAKVGDAVLKNPFKIKANSTVPYPFKLKGSIGNLLASRVTSIISALQGKSPEINIKGNLKARAFIFSKTIPIDVKTKIPLNGIKL